MEIYPLNSVQCINWIKCPLMPFIFARTHTNTHTHTIDHTHTEQIHVHAHRHTHTLTHLISPKVSDAQQLNKNTQISHVDRGKHFQLHSPGQLEPSRASVATALVCSPVQPTRCSVEHPRPELSNSHARGPELRVSPLVLLWRLKHR